MRHLYIQGFMKNYIFPYLINPFNQFFLTDGTLTPFFMSPTKNLIYHKTKMPAYSVKE